MINFWILLIIVVSSLIKGVTGFGFSLFSFPLLLIWYSPKEIIPVLLICNLVSSIMIVLQKKETKLLDKQSYILLISGGVFTILGVWALSLGDGKLLVNFSGLFFILLTLFVLFKINNRTKIMKDRAYFSAGAFIGFLTGAISVSGPPLALFLNRANVSNRKFREIFAAFSIITASVAIITFYIIGIMNQNSILLSLIFAPILLLGSIVGKKLNSRISNKSFQLINIVLTLLASVLMVLSK